MNYGLLFTSYLASIKFFFMSPSLGVFHMERKTILTLQSSCED